MRCVRLALVFAATMFVVVASEAQPQPPTAITPTPLAVVILSGIDDPAVVADLKLQDEQVKALVARRKELWDEAYITSPNKLAESAAARAEATDALLKKTLSAEQYKRATQLGAQSVLGRGFGGPEEAPAFNLTRVSGTTLTRYPELAAAFKLTDEQKKQLTAPIAKGDKGDRGGFGARTIAVSKEQADSAREFLGAVAKTWAAKSDPRVAERPVAPAGVTLLDAKDVRTDLKLTDAEGKALTALSDKWQKLLTDRRADLSPKDADAQAAVLKAETEKALAALKPEQVTRLKQINFRMNFSRGFGTVTEMTVEQLYTNEAVARELAVTEKQVEEFQALRAAFEKDAAGVLATASAFDTAEKKLNELAAARRKKAEGLLTADQTAKFKALVGEPFTGNTRSDRVTGPGTGWPGVGGPGGFNTATVRAETFGKHSLAEFNFLARNKAVQEELKLDEKQIARAVEVEAKIQQATTPNPSEAVARQKNFDERSRMVAEELGKLLTEDQAKRFRQIMLQYHDSQNTGPSATRTAVSYPGVAEAVKLTGDQKTKLLAGTPAADVLTADQKSALKAMLGDPFKGTLTYSTRPGGAGAPGGPGAPGGRPGTIPGTPAADPERAWTTLQRLTGDTGDTVDFGKIPPQTQTMLKTMIERTGGIPLPESGTMTKAAYIEYTGKNDTARADFRGQLGAANPRLAREWTFGRYTSELGHLSRNESIRTELKLTPEQVKKVNAAYHELLGAFPVAKLNAATTDAEKAKWFEGRSKAAENALGAILTADQAKRLREIMLQDRERPLTVGQILTVVHSAASYPGVAEAVKLTDDQKAKLLDGTEAADILTADQKAAVQKLLGDPYKGTFPSAPAVAGGGGGFTPAPRTTPVSPLIRLVGINKAGVEEALKLTPEQAKTFDAAWTAYQTALAAVPPATGPGQAADLNQKRADARAAFDKAAAGLFAPAQEKRLAQLTLQLNAATSLTAALTAPDTAKALELTNEQIAKLTALAEEATKLQTLRTTYIATAPDEKLGLQMRDSADDRMMAVLADAQKKKWKELTGDPLPGLQKTVPGRFGPGGFGGSAGGGIGGPGGGFGGPIGP